MKKHTLNQIIVNGKRVPYIQDEVLIGEWKQIEALKASEITHRDTDTEILTGLLFKGYEMKWGEVNTNGELYEKTAFDRFIKEYFVAKGLNMPCTLEHSYNPHDIIGRVLYVEVNSVGYYFVVYVPATCPEYNFVLWLAEQGLIQGFSKEGYVTNGKWERDNNGEEFFHIREIMTTRVSLVCTPANGVKFEKVQKVENSLAYRNTIENDEEEPASCLRKLFNQK